MGNGSLNLELRLKYPPSCNGGYSLVLIKSLDEEGTSPLKLVSREAMRPNHDDNRPRGYRIDLLTKLTMVSF